MFDDGAHGDGAANDGVYADFFTDTGVEGSYIFTVTAVGTSPTSGAFTREATKATVVTLNSHIELTPMSFTVTLNEGANTTETLNIGNTGSAPLNWSLSASSSTPRSQPKPAYPASYYEKLSKEEPDSRTGYPVTLGSGGPDGFGYSWIDSNEPGGPTFAWFDITGVGTAVALSDDSFEEVALPFVFSFYGENKNLVKIGSNGYLTFGIDGTNWSNDPIPSTTDPDDIICPF